MRVCVLLKLRDGSNLQRVAKDVPQIVRTLEGFAKSSELIFKSSDGLHFGYFVETDRPLGAMQAAVTNSQNFLTDDSILIFEVGEQFTGHHFVRQWTWLQHHR